MKKLILAVVAVFALVGCSTSPAAPPSYRPVPDSRLFAQVRALPGVISSDLSYSDTFGATGYVGIVKVAPGIDEKRVLDETLAILWQGKYRASYNVQVAGDGPFAVIPREIGLDMPADYVKRYGPQPGTGRVAK